MAKTDNFSSYVCDRCGQTEYLQANAPKVSSWHTVKRVSADGVDVSRLLCESCYTGYKTLAASQDAAFNEYMNGSGTE